ncbi:MAG: DUF4019 domain-containing protein [Calditrichae bacterium]|nr:DUF4019 domain-containing protein [Calditrichia bacterium]
MKFFTVLVILTIAILLSCTKTGHPVEEEAAADAATQWLALVDSAQYEQSWNESSDIFQKAISKSAWEQQLHSVRDPLGNLISREVQSTQYSTSLPGAPDGEYVVITFKTSFENKKAAIETVTPMKDSLGVWRVSGYYIR